MKKKPKPRRIYQHQHGDIVFIVVSKETKHVHIFRPDDKGGKVQRILLL